MIEGGADHSSGSFLHNNHSSTAGENCTATGRSGESLLIRSLTLTRLQMGSRFVLMCVCVCVYLSSEGLKSPKIERSHSHLHVLCYDAHTEIQAHIYQEQCV